MSPGPDSSARLLYDEASAAVALSLDPADVAELVAQGALSTIVVCGKQLIARAVLERFVEGLGSTRQPAAPALAPAGKRLLTVPEAAKTLGVGTSTRYRLVRERAIPFRRAPGIRFTLSDLEAFEAATARPVLPRGRRR